LTLLGIFFWSAAARRRFLSFYLRQRQKKESGVEPPHSKSTEEASMKWRVLLFCLAFGVFWQSDALPAEGPLPLRVLYVGNNRTRADEYAAFLKKHFARVTLARRDGFDPASARNLDIVLLDWSQSESDVSKAESPFGKLENWSKPTVLLGSAGLFMAGRWQLIGGAG